MKNNLCPTKRQKSSQGIWNCSGRNYFGMEQTASYFFTDIRTALRTFRNDENTELENSCIYYTENFSNKYQRARTREISDAKKIEIKGLIERGIFK